MIVMQFVDNVLMFVEDNVQVLGVCGNNVVMCGVKSVIFVIIGSVSVLLKQLMFVICGVIDVVNKFIGLFVGGKGMYNVSLLGVDVVNLKKFVVIEWM